jgi:hypothetical protein
MKTIPVLSTCIGDTGNSLVRAVRYFIMGRKTLQLIIVLLLGHAVAQLGEALRYKTEGRGFDSRLCHWNFSFTQSFRPHYGPGVDSASNINDYQEYFLRVKKRVRGRLLGLSAALQLLVSRLYPWPPLSSLIHLQRRLVPHRHERPQPAN